MPGAAFLPLEELCKGFDMVGRWKRKAMGVNRRRSGSSDRGWKVWAGAVGRWSAYVYRNFYITLKKAGRNEDHPAASIISRASFISALTGVS